MKSVEAHYAQPGLLERVREALRQSGMDPDKLNESELSQRDQFHIGGLEATNSLARLAGIRREDRVLDLGSGVGGPSRYLAATIGCHVTGLDLTPEYCQVATMLAESTGLSNLVAYHQGDALHTPFDNAAFDVVWTQHAAMNIEDKRALYSEMSRVLKPGGRLAIHDIVAGSGDVLYPVPWAATRGLSFLITAESMGKLLADQGFTKVVSQDITTEGVDALRQVAATASPRGFGLRTLMGPEFPAMLANLIANLKTGACRVIHATYTN